MSKRILVVEDEALIADDIQRTLIGLGYDVPTPVATGLEAIAAAATLEPDLILMDIKLQGSIDGIEAAVIIRQHHGIPVVYLTSHSDDATLARAMATDPAGYLLKPFIDRELRTAIEVALHKHGLEARLAERERWFSTTLQSLREGVIATDPAGQVTFMNTAAETLTGWQNVDAQGHPLAEVFRLGRRTSPPVTGPLPVPFQRALADALHADDTLGGRGGGDRSIDQSAAPIVDAGGNALGGVVVFRDVTEKRKLERRLVQAERMASLGTLAAGMGHQINNPLAAVTTNLEFAAEMVTGLRAKLEKSPASDAPALVAAAIRTLTELGCALLDAHEGADRVRRIVVDLRTLATGAEPRRSSLRLSEVLDAAARMSAHPLWQRTHFVKEYADTPRIDADEAQLVQVFSNLIINAMRAQEGRDQIPEVRLVTYTDADGSAVAEVRDSGMGISDGVLSKVFDPFFTTSSQPGAIGLGLAISHHVVTSLGGRIVVESRLGQGTVCRVSLPAAPRAQQAASAPGPS